MRAICIARPGEMSLVDVPKTRANEDEVVVEVRAVGICGSDLELFDGTRPLAYVSYPVVPGHEWAGVVVEAGSRADCEPGDRVVAEGFRYCGKCARCLEGHTNLCTAGYAETGFTHLGGFADFVTVPSRLIHKLPGGTNFGAAALLEPAACVAEGLMDLDLRPDLQVGVVGAGTLGLIAVAFLHLVRPARLVLVGSRQNRLDIGRELGASETAEPGLAHQLDSQLDIVFEATNRPGGAQLACLLTRRGGTVIVEGINGSPSPSVVSDLISLKHLRVQGVFGASREAWRWAVGRVAESNLRLDRLVTHRFQFEEFATAFATVADPAAAAVKVQFIP